MEIYCVMVVDFQPRGREDFSTPDGWTLKRKAQELLWGPCPLWTGDTLSVLICNMFRTLSFRYQFIVPSQGSQLVCR